MNECTDIAAVEGSLAIARLETLLLAVASQANDEDAVLIAAGRLRWTLACAQQFAARSPAVLIRMGSRLAAAHQAGQRWLPQRSPSELTGERLRRVVAELHEPSFGLRALRADDMLVTGFELDDLPLPAITFRRSTISHVSAQRARLDNIDATGAKIVHACLDAASLRLGVLNDAVIEECGFARANLEGTTWGSARVSRCTVSRAVLLCARLQGARFFDCDFRDAYFQCLPDTETSGAEFVRCDLRGTCWHGREMARVSFIDCKLHGIHGGVTGLEDAVIEGADLSPAGDGTQLATKGEVLAAWYHDAGAGAAHGGGAQ